MRWKGKLSATIKFTLFFLLFITLTIVISYFAMQYGVQAGDIQYFLAETWLLWLCVRLSIYALCGYLLYRILQLVQNEQDQIAYKRLIKVLIIGVIVTEIVIRIQQGG